MTRHQRVFLVFLCLALVIIGVSGFLMRPVADDFCELAIAQQYGPLEGTLYWFENWSGRISLFATKSILYSAFGATVPSLMPAALLILIVTAWTLALRPLLGKSSLLIVLSVIVGALLGLPNIYQGLYWSSASLMVLTPIGVGGLLCASLVRQKSILLSIALAVFAAGFYESYSLIQAIILVAFWYRTRRADMLAAFAATIVTLGIGLVSPGNAVRAANETTMAIDITSAIMVVQAILVHFIDTILRQPIVVLLPFAVGLHLQPFRNEHRLRTISLITGTVFVLACMTIAPILVVLSSIPPRSFMLPQVLLAIGMVLIGSVFSRNSQNWSGATVMVAFAALLLTLSIVLRLIPYAIIDATERSETGASHVLPSLMEVAGDNASYVLRCQQGAAVPHDIGSN
jgi:hypothetical protein